VVARRRARGAKFIEDARLGNVIVLDDGFQHRRLARDLDILVSYVGNPEAKRDFIEGRLLPEGRFREARDHAFRRAGMLVFSERQPSEAAAAIDPALLRMVPAGIQIYRSFIEVQEARNLMDGKVLPPQSVVAVCGIAHPESFLATLRQADYAVSASYCFPDHSAFSDAEISGIKARHPGLPLVCTEKDAVRLTGSNRERVSELRIATKVIPGDAFITQICRVIRHRQQQAAGDVVGFHPKTRKMKLNE
jgi:tetraacyldisaccharide 4'-kinase